MNVIGLKKLVKYIEENIRVSNQTSINYIDPRGHIPRLNSRQNQVIYGRRGSGKSLLVKTLQKKQDNDFIYIKINLEDFKDVSFPNSILHVLINFFSQLNTEVLNSYEWYELRKNYNAKKISKALKAQIKLFKQQLLLPDNYDENIKSTATSKIGGGVKTPIGRGEVNLIGEKGESTEIQKSHKKDKLSNIRNIISDLKELITSTTLFLKNKHIFLVLDDFYFIRKIDQPYFVDFFHRLSKDTNLYLKIATIRHRSSLYVQADNTYVGIELSHDAQSLELDYTLDQFQQLQNFMWELLREANRNSNADVNLDEIITENAFKQLCLASGGVPRDFLALFIKLCNNIISGKPAISKPDVTDLAIESLPYKFENFKTDSAEEREVLEKYLDYLKRFMIEEKRTNICLVSNSDINNYPQIRQAIKELVDLRLIHLVDANTSSAPSDGKRYTAYMIDIGLYPNSKPRNFNQIEPGLVDAEGRKDNIRSAPKVHLEDYKAYIDGQNLGFNLEVTEG